MSEDQTFPICRGGPPRAVCRALRARRAAILDDVAAASKLPTLRYAWSLLIATDPATVIDRADAFWRSTEFCARRGGRIDVRIDDAAAGSWWVAAHRIGGPAPFVIECLSHELRDVVVWAAGVVTRHGRLDDGPHALPTLGGITAGAWCARLGWKPTEAA